MRCLPLTVALSITLWAIIIELAVGLVVVLSGAPAAIGLADIAAAVPALIAIPLGWGL